MNTYQYELIETKEALSINKELMELGGIAFGQHSHKMSADNAAKMQAGIANEKMWAGMIEIAKVFVCKNNEAVVGMAFLIPKGNPWDIFKAEWCYLRMVSVHPNHQGYGIGKKLTQMCIDYAKEANEQIMALHTSEMMDAARHVYENLGFTILEEIEPRLGKRYWIYTLNLN